MIEKYYAAHLKTRLDASAINIMRPRPKKRRFQGKALVEWKPCDCGGSVDVCPVLYDGVVAHTTPAQLQTLRFPLGALPKAAVRAAGLPFALVDERETTLQARARFFIDHPPRGWRRLMPRGMLLPDRPIDDYAALLIAERYLRLAD